MIHDCDPGTDDAIALAVLAGRSDCDLAAITTVGGNVGITATTRNASGLAAFLSLNVPVYRGSGTALTRPFPAGAPHVHGRDGLGGLAKELPRGRLQEGSAVSVLNQFVLATGPLTNVAIALRSGNAISRVVWMGGSVLEGGNITPGAEFNAWCDPQACDVVLTSDVELEIVPLDVTHKVKVTPKAVRQLQAGGRIANFFSRLIEARHGDTALHDPVAVIAALEPSLFTWEDRSARCETSDGPARGVTIVDRRPSATGPIRIAMSVRGTDVLDRIIGAILAADAARR